MVPQCAALGRKPDKLTILRMAVSHMKAIRGNAPQVCLQINLNYKKFLDNYFQFELL